MRVRVKSNWLTFPISEQDLDSVGGWDAEVNKVVIFDKSYNVNATLDQVRICFNYAMRENITEKQFKAAFERYGNSLIDRLPYLQFYDSIEDYVETVIEHDDRISLSSNEVVIEEV